MATENPLNQNQQVIKDKIDSDLKAEAVKSFTLYRGYDKKEEIIVSSTDQAVNAICDGFFFYATAVWQKTPQVIDFEATFGVDIHQVLRDRDLKQLKEMFSENQHRELLYLSVGLESWFENVNNYWYNRNWLGYLEKIQKEFPPASLERQLWDSIYMQGIMRVLHNDPKDVSAWANGYDRFNSEIGGNPQIPKEFCLDVDTLRENCVFDMARMAAGRISWKNGIIPDRLIPKDIKVKERNPLLEPFEKTLESLKVEGVTEIPSWLAEQGRMAGLSAVYQDFPLRLRDWIEKATKIIADYEKYIKEKNIQDAPHVYLPTEYLEDHLIIDEKINRRNG